METDERIFNELVPLKSTLGREFQWLLKERQSQQQAFEQAADKMVYETSPYRRSVMAVDRFLSEWLPRVQRAVVVMDAQAKENLLNHEAATLRWEFGMETPVDRRSEARIWQHYALSKYRILRPQIKRCKIYHPLLVSRILSAWKTFRNETMIWKYGGMPWDGSRAMHAMFDFILNLDLLSSVDD